jgi:hypothetical protein
MQTSIAEIEFNGGGSGQPIFANIHTGKRGFISDRILLFSLSTAA